MKIYSSNFNYVNLFYNPENKNQNNNILNESQKEFVDKSTSTEYNEMYYEEKKKEKKI